MKVIHSFATKQFCYIEVEQEVKEGKLKETFKEHYEVLKVVKDLEIEPPFESTVANKKFDKRYDGK